MEIRQGYNQSLRLDMKSSACLPKEFSFGNEYKRVDERESEQCVHSFAVSYRAKTAPALCSSLSDVPRSCSFRAACLP